MLCWGHAGGLLMVSKPAARLNTAAAVLALPTRAPHAERQAAALQLPACAPCLRCPKPAWGLGVLSPWGIRKGSGRLHQNLCCLAANMQTGFHQGAAGSFLDYLL